MVEIQAKLAKLHRKIANKKLKIETARQKLSELEIRDGRDIVSLQNQVKEIDVHNEEMRQKKKYLELMTKDVHTLKDLERNTENERRLEEQVRHKYIY